MKTLTKINQYFKEHLPNTVLKYEHIANGLYIFQSKPQSKDNWQYSSDVRDSYKILNHEYDLFLKYCKEYKIKRYVTIPPIKSPLHSWVILVKL